MSDTNITSVQKSAIEQIIAALRGLTGPRKRNLAGMFLEMVDRDEFPEYYEVITQPRAIKPIQAKLANNEYKTALDVHTDLSLVFWNALFYNEEGSDISRDAEILKTTLDNEWKKHSTLPPPRSNPPEYLAQKAASLAAKQEDEEEEEEEPEEDDEYEPQTKRANTRSNTTRIEPIPLHLKGKNVVHDAAQDMDVDIGGSPQAETQPSDYARRDDESDEIVRQLEKGMPRWPGFDTSTDEGWFTQATPERLTEIVHVIKSHKDVVGNRHAAALDAVPEESNLPNLSYSYNLSLRTIESRARASQYATAKDFDIDMARLFEKARRWHPIGSEPYGHVLLLQRLYNDLTSANPSSPPYVSQTNWAALRAGPGNAKPPHTSEVIGVAGVTTFRLPVKDRTFIEEVKYKGFSFKMGDWLHLANADDPSLPIVAQVYRCWISEEKGKKGQQGVTAAWYFRPEHTYHTADRRFWEGEVFKTSHFGDHPLADIIQKVAVQFTAQHIRGRPRPPFYYPDSFPVYVCNSRYNDRERYFVRVKNWNSCVPEELRKKDDFMPIYDFERNVIPRTVISPYLMGKSGSVWGKWPGGIVAGTVADTEKKTKGKPRRPEKNVIGPSHATPAAPYTPVANANYAYLQSALAAAAASQQQLSKASKDRSFGSMINLAGAQVEKLSQELARHFDRDPETNEVLWFAAPPSSTARPAAPKHSLTYLHYLATKQKKRERGDAMEVDEAAAKKPKQTMHEALNEHWNQAIVEGRVSELPS